VSEQGRDGGMKGGGGRIGRGRGERRELGLDVCGEVGRGAGEQTRKRGGGEGAGKNWG